MITPLLRRRKLFICVSLSFFLLCLVFYYQDLISDQPESAESIAQHDNSLDDASYLPYSEAWDHCRQHKWRPYARREQRRKVYDLFMINTELDWLQIRLAELQDEVDYFIVVEAPLTFTGLPKPSHVRDSWERFKPWHKKMIYHMIQEDDLRFKDTWEHEAFQRNSMYTQALSRLESDMAPSLDDIILISDVDEIPRPETIKTLRNCQFPRKLTLASRFYYYSFQWLHHGKEWNHPQATFYEGPKDTILPEKLRHSDEKAEIFHNASWHCSSCFSSIDEFVTKITSFSHTKYNQPEFVDRKNILMRVKNGLDLFNRTTELYDRIQDNQDVPKYLKENSNIYGYILDRDPPSGNFHDYTEADKIN